MRKGFCAAAIVGLAVLPAGGAAAQSGMLVQSAGAYGSGYAAVPRAGSGGYGGGFIEMLMTGGDPDRVAQPRRAAPVAADGTVYAAPARGGYGSGAYVGRDLGYGRAADPFAEERGAGGYNGSYGGGYAAPRAGVAALPSGDPGAGRVGRALDPRYQRQTVAYEGSERPGTIIVDTPQKFLYLVQPGGQALRYGIGVGRPGFSWSGMKTVSAKREWPDWTPPPEMIKRRPDLPAHMEGGPSNPLGARALYLGSSLYRIHGTNEPYTIGQSVSSGCIRMMNEDVTDLYERVPVGTKVLVI